MQAPAGPTRPAPTPPWETLIGDCCGAFSQADGAPRRLFNAGRPWAARRRGSGCVARQNAFSACAEKPGKARTCQILRNCYGARAKAVWRAAPRHRPCGALTSTRLLVKPLLFGQAEAPLFGVYHPTGSRRQPRLGVLLCYPGPREYNSAHWAFRRLAGLLSKAGLPTLRFDYRGTGDSAGELDQTRIADWSEDVAVAAHELRAQSGCRELAIVAMRLGALPAMMACNAGLGLNSLVLWQPVMSGEEYLSELRLSHERRRIVLLHAAREAHGDRELLGFNMSDAQRQELAALRAEAHWLRNVPRVTIVHPPASFAFYRYLGAAPREATQPTVIEVTGSAAPRTEKAMLSNDALEAIVSALQAGGHSND